MHNTLQEVGYDLRDALKKSHLTGQHCQRNYDLEKTMPQEDIDTIIHAATQCPSKQNLDFYSIVAIEDRNVIEAIYETTETAKGRKNPQVLGHLLLVFVANPNRVSKPDYEKGVISQGRNDELRNIHENAGKNVKLLENIVVDMHQAVGVAAGFINVTASMLGYRCGCNKCFDAEQVKEILGLGEGEEPLLMMGVGIKDDSRNRREEQNTGMMIETFKKMPITVKHIK